MRMTGSFADVFAPVGRRDGDADVFGHGCVLAIDGHSYASIFGDALTRGRVVVRVGGFKQAPNPELGGSRVSYFQWFEPLLVDGVHYVRATVDTLRDTVHQVHAMRPAEQRRIAKRAHEAAGWLFSLQGRRCYSLLALAHTPRPYTCDSRTKNESESRPQRLRMSDHRPQSRLP